MKNARSEWPRVTLPLPQVHVGLVSLGHDLLGTVSLLQKRNPFRSIGRQDSHNRHESCELTEQVLLALAKSIVLLQRASEKPPVLAAATHGPASAGSTRLAEISRLFRRLATEVLVPAVPCRVTFSHSGAVPWTP